MIRRTAAPVRRPPLRASSPSDRVGAGSSRRPRRPGAKHGYPPRYGRPGSCRSGELEVRERTQERVAHKDVHPELGAAIEPGANTSEPAGSSKPGIEVLDLDAYQD